MRRNVLPPENASATDTPSRQELLHLPWETGSEQPQIGHPHNGKSRLVPHGPRIAGLVGEQVERRRADGKAAAPDVPLFSFDGKRCVHPGTASQTFHHLVPTLGLAVPEGISPPTLHSLRHSFAVGSLLRWYREGLDPQDKLHQLSTFMGHVDPVSTAVYLTITPQLLNEASRRFEAFAEASWAEVAR